MKLDNISSLTVIYVSNTRWESRIKSVKELRFQAPQIRNGLASLYDICMDAKSKSEVESLAIAIENFEFFTWHGYLV